MNRSELIEHYTGTTFFEEGTLVELEFRGASYDKPSERGRETRIGYVVRDKRKSITLSKCFPQIPGHSFNLFRNSQLRKCDISGFHILAAPNEEGYVSNAFQSWESSPLPPDILPGSLIEIIEQTKEDKSLFLNRRKAGYVKDVTHTIGSGGYQGVESCFLCISMDHPSNKYSYSPRVNQRADLLNHVYRVFGRKDLW
ncbi:MAG TPA: hypothetical protein VJJ21_02280 [Candidatus Nanoarchaeia archaeon]|nr:hypothetical protein [Candidatus Nanoarchaeia archaeon]